MNQFNWDQAFTLDFDLNDGLSKHAETTKRYLSQDERYVSRPAGS